jgi:glyoxylase-like metal-dependent hydrolase (beta-lactamase superfamily II)
MENRLKCEVIPVTAFEQNCSLVWDAETMKGTLVDAGGDAEHLLERVRHHGVQLEKLLVTHGHLDHAGAVRDIAEKLKLPVEGPQEEDKFWIDLMPAAARQYGFPPCRSFTPDRWLHEGDKVTVGGLSFDVIHCPGHTPGHVVFYNAPAKAAFVGDVLFQGSIGRTDFPRGNHADLIHSIRHKLFPLGDDITFVPGHGPLSTFGRERIDNPYVADGVTED